MTDYNETDERSYVARHADELISGLIRVRNGLQDILMLRSTLEYAPPEGSLLAEGFKERQAARQASTDLLLQEVAAALGAAASGSVETVQNQIDHLKQIQRVEEAFPGQPA